MPNEYLYSIKFQHILIIGSTILSTNVFTMKKSSPRAHKHIRSSDQFIFFVIHCVVNSIQGEAGAGICVVAYLSMQQRNKKYDYAVQNRIYV